MKTSAAIPRMDYKGHALLVRPSGEQVMLTYLLLHMISAVLILSPSGRAPEYVSLSAHCGVFVWVIVNMVREATAGKNEDR